MAPGKNHVTAMSTEIFKYVRIHPNFASRPVWCEKMFLCCFSLKAGRKDLTNRPEVLFQPPPPPPPHHTHSPNCSFPPEKCWIWIHEIWETPCYNNTGTSFHITQVDLRSLGGFWHTCKFQSKWRLRGSCPEPFKYICIYIYMHRDRSSSEG